MAGSHMLDTKVLTRIRRRASQAVDAVGLWPAAFAVLIMVGLIFVAIVSRLFGYPISLVEEYVAYFVAMVVLLGGSWVVKQDTHISINVIPDLLRPRVRTGLEIVTTLVALGVIAFFLVIETNLVIQNIKTGINAWTPMHTPLWTVQSIMVIGLTLFVIQIVVRLVNKVKILFLHQ